ncbi:unnamed protein product [Gulo gulo]|uniref:Uncharacterized protein n=1 Tax=Gulo gulo TaxID=48420 RepID=A0A9X9LDW1_GULGU|nr:unnamed protein product [Gulo gulo]
MALKITNVHLRMISGSDLGHTCTITIDLKEKGLLNCIPIAVCELLEHGSPALTTSFLTSKQGRPFPGVNAICLPASKSQY